MDKEQLEELRKRLNAVEIVPTPAQNEARKPLPTPKRKRYKLPKKLPTPTLPTPAESGTDMPTPGTKSDLPYTETNTNNLPTPRDESVGVPTPGQNEPTAPLPTPGGTKVCNGKCGKCLHLDSYYSFTKKGIRYWRGVCKSCHLEQTNANRKARKK